MGAGTLECDVTFTKDLGARLPALAERSRDDDGHLADAARADLHRAVHARAARRERRRAVVRPASRVPHERAHARRVQDAAGQDRCVRSGGADRRAVRRAAPAPRARISARASSAARCSRTPRASRCFERLGVRMTPELKEPSVELPFNGLTREQLAQKLIDEYRAAGVPPSDVLAAVVRSARRRVLDRARARVRRASGAARRTRCPWVRRARGGSRSYKAAGINIWAPPLFVLLDLDAEGRIVPSRAARAARAAGLDIIAWTLERSGNLAAPNNGFYYRTIDAAITREGDVLQVVDVLGARRRRARHLLRLAGDRQFLCRLRRSTVTAARSGSRSRAPRYHHASPLVGLRMRGEFFIVATLVVAGCASAQQRWLAPSRAIDRDRRDHGVRAAASGERPDDDRARARRHGVVHARATATASAA